MKIRVTLTIEVNAESVHDAERNLRDTLVGNDDVCDVDEARETLDFSSIEMVSRVVGE